MDINCPYCETHYELVDSLIPEGTVKLKCRVCSNVFYLDKDNGKVSKLEDKVKTVAGTDAAEINIPATPRPRLKSSMPPPKESSENPAVDDFMQSIMSEINRSVAEETGEETGQTADGGANGLYSKNGEGSKAAGVSASKFNSNLLFQIAVLTILVLLFLIAATGALIHYNIIYIPFFPKALSDFLSSV